MSYPKNIVLTKLNTLPEAEYPQPEKYPDGTERSGLMWEHTLPTVGKPFYVLTSKMWDSLRTSPITEILSQTEEEVVFKTLNSTYKLSILNLV